MIKFKKNILIIVGATLLFFAIFSTVLSVGSFQHPFMRRIQGFYLYHINIALDYVITGIFKIDRDPSKFLEKSLPEKLKYLINDGDLFLVDSEFELSASKYGSAYILDPNNLSVTEKLLELNEIDSIVNIKEEYLKKAINFYINNKLARSLYYFQKIYIVAPYDVVLKSIIKELEIKIDMPSKPKLKKK